MDGRFMRAALNVASAVVLGAALAVAAPSAATAQSGPPVIDFGCGPGGQSWFYCAVNPSSTPVEVRWWWNEQPVPAWEDWVAVTGSCSGPNLVRVAVSNEYGTTWSASTLQCSNPYY